jgi:hypothetical protein
MQDNRPKLPDVPAAARVLRDGTMIELLYSPLEQRTQFVVCANGEIELSEDVTAGTERLVPYSPQNNLIKHKAVLLPSNPEPFESVAALLEAIQGFIHRYVDLSPLFERIAASYVLLSWVYDAFNELPYLRFQGDYGTGKTRALMVIGSIAYRPFFASGASTVSPIFHTLHAFRGTLVFDEADFRMSDEKAELVKILNNGTVEGMPVLRTLMNPKLEFNPAAFQVFGPKVVATRGTYEDKALESRFLTELMGGRKLRDGIPINLPPSFHQEALALRNQLLMYRLTEHRNVRLDPSLVDASLEPRQNQVLVPLLSIIDDPVFRDAIRDSMRSSGLSLLAERSVSVEGELLGIIVRLFTDHRYGSISMKLVREEFVESFGDEYERPITTRYLTSILRRRLAIRVQKTMGIMAIPRSEESRIRQIALRYGLDNAPELLSREIGRKGDSGEIPLPVDPSNQATT